MKTNKSTLINFSLIFILSSCAWLDRQTEKLFSRDHKQAVSEQEAQYVSRDQYEALLRKYEALKNEKVEANMDSDSYVNHNADELINQLDQSKNQLQTVDAFQTKPKLQSRPNVIASTPVIVDKPVSYQEAQVLVEKYQDAVNLTAKGSLDQALKIFQELERSGLDQVRVRSKFNIGEILYRQNEFDLAMQVYESLLQTHAFSGLVLQSLERLVDCAQKLGLEQKSLEYKSFLNDVFGV
jgi:tetratricopeptide (TPR) repeat protein